MDELDKEQMVQTPASLLLQHDHRQPKYEDQGLINEDCDDIYSTSSSSTDSITINRSNSSPSDAVDDASSPTSTSSSSSTGPLFQLSELMAHLPIKRGLSSFYQGKSQSFTSLSMVTDIEDLPKKQTHCTRKMKSSKSYTNGFDAYKPYTVRESIISKNISRSSCSSFSGRRRATFLSSSCRPPLAPIHKKF